MLSGCGLATLPVPLDAECAALRAQGLAFMTRRFDRLVEGGVRKRRHFASAMTMLGYSDGASHSDGASYLELVEFLIVQFVVVFKNFVMVFPELPLISSSQGCQGCLLGKFMIGQRKIFESQFNGVGVLPEHLLK